MPLSPEERTELAELIRLDDERRAQENAARAASAVAANPAPPPESTTQRTGGTFGFIKNIAGSVAGAIPDPVKTGLGAALSGEKALNLLLPGDPGTAIGEKLESVPKVGGVLRFGFDVVAAPATYLPFTPAARLGFAAFKPLAPLVTGGTRLSRVAGEVGVELAAAGAGLATFKGLDEAEARGANISPFLKLVGPLAVGLGAGIGVSTRVAARTRPTPTLGPGGPAVDKMTELIEKAKPLAKDVKEQRRLDNIKRSRYAQSALERGGGTEEAFERASGVFAGERDLPTPAFEEIKSLMTQEDVDSLLRRVMDSDVIAPNESTVLTRIGTAKTLISAMMGNIPPESGIKRLELFFGPRFTKALVSKDRKLTFAEKAWDNVFDALALPRAVMSSWDLSAPFRQGILLSNRKEFWGAFGPMLRAFGSQDAADAVAASMRAGKMAPLRKPAGLYEAPNVGFGHINDAEEAFMSRLAHWIPGVKRSERAFVTFLNKLRTDYFDHAAERIIKSHGGIVADAAEDLKSMANATNVLTGRGNLPTSDLVSALNLAFFSPRLLAARLQTFSLMITSTPAVRREIARDLVSFVGVGIGALTLLKLSGASVEIDPRSSDFGKARFGNTRYDPWGGFQPLARYVAQLLTGERKNAEGDIVSAGAGDTIGRFTQSKLAPVPGLLVDYLRGQTIIGESADFQNSDDIGQQAASRLLPLFLQDVIDAGLQGRSVTSSLKALPGIVGVGVQSFETRSDLRDRMSSQQYPDGAMSDTPGKPAMWRDLTNQQQQALERDFPSEFAAAEPEVGFGATKNALEAEVLHRESVLNAQLAAQEISGDEFRRAIDGLNKERVIRINQAAEDEGLDFKEREDDPINQFFAVLAQAEVGFGIVDQQERDQLAEEFLAQLSPEDRRKVDEAGFLHDKSVQWYYDAKKIIRDAGYWTVQREAYERFEDILQRFAPDVTTYRSLLTAIRQTTDRSLAARLLSIQRAIDRNTSKARLVLRARNPELARSLAAVYGAKAPQRRRSPVNFAGTNIRTGGFGSNVSRNIAG